MERGYFEDVLKDIGKNGCYQAYVAVLVGLGAAFPGFYTLGNVFLSGIPDYWCGDKMKDRMNSSVLPWASNITDVEYAASPNGSCTDSISSACNNPCNIAFYTGNQRYTYNSKMGEISCMEWVYNKSIYGSTVVTEWNLVCSSEWMVALGQSTYMLGFLLGGISLGNLSDMFGRKVVWLGSMIILFLSAVGAAFMPNYWAFIAFRCISGVVVAGVLVSGFVLAMEITGSQGRMLSNLVFQGGFALGYMILSGVAYLIRDYRYLQLFSGLVALLYLPYFWILDESPRWLLTRNRYTEAAVIIKKAAKMNKRKSPPDFEHEHLNEFTNKEQDEQKKETPVSYSIFTVLKYPTLRWRSINVSFNWFVNSFVYYGLSLGSANLKGGPYLNLFLSGLVEFPSFLVVGLLLNRLGRQKTMVMFLLVAAMCCIAIPCLPQDNGVATVVLSLFGKLCITGSFTVIYVYSAEVYPTVVRNLLVGVGCTFARIGGMVAPFVQLMVHYWVPLPMVFYGSASLAAGFLALFLPETLKQQLPDTLIEGEQFGKNSAKCKACITCLDN